MSCMLAYYREDLVHRAAAVVLRNNDYVYEVHDFEQYRSVANSLGYAIPIGAIEDHVFHDRNEPKLIENLSVLFKNEYNPFTIVKNLFQSKFSSLGYTGRRDSGYAFVVYQGILEFLTVTLEFDRRNITLDYTEYLIMDVDNNVIDLNLAQIQSELIGYFVTEGYFKLSSMVSTSSHEDKYKINSYTYGLSIQCNTDNFNQSLIIVTKQNLAAATLDLKNYYFWLGDSNIVYALLGLTLESFTQLLHKALKNQLMLKFEGAQWIVDWERADISSNLPNFLKLIKNADDAKIMLKAVRVESHEKICIAIGNEWENIICSRDSLIMILKELSPELYPIINRYLSFGLYFIDWDHLENSLEQLDLEQRFVFCVAIQKCLNSIILNSRNFKKLLIANGTQHYDSICKIFSEDKLKQLVSDQNTLIFILNSLSIKELVIFCRSRKWLITLFIRGGSDLVKVIAGLDTSDKRLKFSEIVSGYITEFIETRRDFLIMLKTVLEGNFINELPLHAIPALVKELPYFIETAYEFKQSLSYLIRRQRDSIFKIMKSELPQMIKSAHDISFIFEYLTPGQRIEIFNLIFPFLPDLIQHGWQLASVLKYLALPQRKLVFGKIKYRFHSIISTANDASFVLRVFTEEEAETYFYKSKCVKLVSLVGTNFCNFVLIVKSISVLRYEDFISSLTTRYPINLSNLSVLAAVISELPTDVAKSKFLSVIIRQKSLSSIWCDDTEGFLKVLKELSIFEDYNSACLAMGEHLTQILQPIGLRVILSNLNELQKLYLSKTSGLGFR